MTNIVEIGSVLEEIRQLLADGSRVGIAVGAFGLVHEGTVRFLRAARAECDCLFVAVLPCEKLAAETRMAAALLRDDERLRILAMMEEVNGVGVVDEAAAPLPAWAEAATGATWFRSEEEDDVDAETLALLPESCKPAALSAGPCTTRVLLERISR